MSPKLSFRSACSAWRAALRADTLHGPFPPVRSAVRPAGYFLAIAKANARKRDAFADRIRAGDTSCTHEVTEANACNITLRPSKSGTVRPGRYVPTKSASKAQSADRPAPAPSFATAVRAFAVRVSEKHVRQAKLDVRHLRAEFVTEVESAAGEFFAVRLARFPSLAADLLPRFACDALPRSTVRALNRAARRACDARMRRLAKREQAFAPSFFNVFADENDGPDVRTAERMQEARIALARALATEDEGAERDARAELVRLADSSLRRSAEVDAVFVNARCDSLLALVRAKSGGRGRGRAIAAHCSLIETAREFFLAQIDGRAVSLPSAGLVSTYSETGYNVATLRKSRAAAQVRPDGARFASRVNEADGRALASSGYSVRERDAFRADRGAFRGKSGAGAGRLANSALYKRMLRLARFAGAPDILSALGVMTGANV